ncbi:Sapep family Mn(2+)-dependent dipeptidase [bacterium]|nr:Sapep family Mn(2+)-dependent dipeptidase [bacterium]
MLCHLDVVPPGTGWSADPFSGEYRDGRVHGRGSADNKCACLSALFSVRILREMGIVPKRKIRIIFGTDEECGSSDMPVYFSKMPLPDVAIVPDAGEMIINREKGRILLRLRAGTPESTVLMRGGIAPNSVPDKCELALLSGGGTPTRKSFSGKPWHGAWPSEGVNAISLGLADLEKSGQASGNALVDFLMREIGGETDGSRLGVACADELSGALTVNLGTVDAGRGASEALLDIRYPVTRSGERIIAAVRSAAARYGVEAVAISDAPPLFVDEESFLIKRLKLACEKVTGAPAMTQSMGGRTYAACLAGRGVAYGPGAGEGAHQADEYVDMERLMRHLRISTQALYELACAD